MSNLIERLSLRSDPLSRDAAVEIERLQSTADSRGWLIEGMEAEIELLLTEREAILSAAYTFRDFGRFSHLTRDYDLKCMDEAYKTLLEVSDE